VGWEVWERVKRPYDKQYRDADGEELDERLRIGKWKFNDKVRELRIN
jgi:hypothetical protein